MSNRRNIGILFFTLVVVMMGFGMIIPILPFYVEQFNTGGSTLGLLMATYALMQFIFAPVWGRLSDQHGRKPILMVGILGNAIASLLFGLSTQLWMLFAARALAGILSSATLPTAMAYIGDSTSEEDRGGGMGILGAAMGVGMVIGPGVGGWLAVKSLSLPFFLAAGLSMVALLLVWWLLPETLTLEEQAKARATAVEGSFKTQFRDMWQALSGPIAFLLVLAFLLSFGMTNFESVFGLYSLERFNYGPQQVGGILMFVGVISAVVQGGLTGVATRRWGEAAIIKASLLGSAIGFALMLLAFNMATVLLTVGFFVLSNSMLRPAVSSLTSRRATGGQGIAMGLNNSFMSLGRIAGPVLAGFLFDVNIHFPYVIGALVMMLGFVLCGRYLETAPTMETAVSAHS
ncbi:MAG: MFS transporter [Candidatus Promineifilaceae bacterium]|nr:MFS transporter [Chloroflexota bacterium]